MEFRAAQFHMNQHPSASASVPKRALLAQFEAELAEPGEGDDNITSMSNTMVVNDAELGSVASQPVNHIDQSDANFDTITVGVRSSPAHNLQMSGISDRYQNRGVSRQRRV